ncbi:hypothetical protein MPTK1_3g09295R1 [Marchantia polymorpha subsp. ruderalis]
MIELSQAEDTSSMIELDLIGVGPASSAFCSAAVGVRPFHSESSGRTRTRILPKFRISARCQTFEFARGFAAPVASAAPACVSLL